VAKNIFMFIFTEWSIIFGGPSPHSLKTPR
jgi:hypothetical protein